MPWSVRKSEECPASKPWACIKDDDGEVEGCHETEEAAEAQRRALYANEGASSMQHLKVKAAATTTDKGEFSAIAAAYTIDRVRDQIVPGAFEKTIKAWQASQKMIPLHWDHSGEPEDIIGSADPSTMRETKEGLYVEGKLDLENSEKAREAWRSMKNNALALSFGYLATKTKKKGKVTQLLEIDLFEISIVPAPANADTRVLSLKSALDRKQTMRVERNPEACSMEEPWAMMDGDEAMSCHATEDEARAAMQERMNSGKSFKDIEAVQAYLDEHFPGHTITKASEKTGNPLTREAWDLVTRGAFGGPLPKAAPESEPEPVEPIDSAALQREAWSLALKK